MKNLSNRVEVPKLLFRTLKYIRIGKIRIAFLQVVL